MTREDRTVRESVQPTAKTQAINLTLAVTNVAENLAVVGMEEWRKISLIASHDVFLAFDIGIAVAPTAANSLRLNAGEEYHEDLIRVTERMRFINAVAGETPALRGIAWGV